MDPDTLLPMAYSIKVLSLFVWVACLCVAQNIEFYLNFTSKHLITLTKLVLFPFDDLWISIFQVTKQIVFYGNI